MAAVAAEAAELRQRQRRAVGRREAGRSSWRIRRRKTYFETLPDGRQMKGGWSPRHAVAGDEEKYPRRENIEGIFKYFSHNHRL